MTLIRIVYLFPKTNTHKNAAKNFVKSLVPDAKRLKRLFRNKARQVTGKISTDLLHQKRTNGISILLTARNVTLSQQIVNPTILNYRVLSSRGKK